MPPLFLRPLLQGLGLEPASPQLSLSVSSFMFTLLMFDVV